MVDDAAAPGLVVTAMDLTAMDLAHARVDDVTGDIVISAGHIAQHT